jgi:sec-independent protein translocase protein TatA
MFATIAPPEILIPIAIIIVLLGARKLPDIGRGLGQGIKEFKDATKKSAAEASKDEEPKPPTTES